MKKDLLRFIEFKEESGKLIKSKTATYFTKIEQKHPQLYKDFLYFYDKLLHKKPKQNNCMAFIDGCIELIFLKDNQIINRIMIKHRLKDNMAFQIDGKYYASKNTKLTNEICEKIYQKYGAEAFEHYELNTEKAPDLKEITKKAVTEHFEVVPKEIKDIIEPKEEPKEEPKDALELLTHKELVEMIKQLRQSGKTVEKKGNKKADLIEAIKNAK